jgi:streptomycin 6-kinase
MHPTVPSIDDGMRRRLVARFGAGVDAWLDELPHVLGYLATRWQVELGAVIPQGRMSVVVRCLMPDGRPAVLKVSPDKERLANEAAALGRWGTAHTPSVYAVDENAGALVLEAIEPGTPLIESSSYPRLESVADLLTSLHATGVPDLSYPSLAQRVSYLFDMASRTYARRPDLAAVLSKVLYERGWRLAARLVEHVPTTALLHGDLTPRNILDGGTERGLVAIDPAPCLGDDLSFDAVDLLLWQADDVDVIVARAEELAPAIDADVNRILDWCTAFAGMVALELAEADDSPTKHIEALASLAARAPTD